MCVAMQILVEGTSFKPSGPAVLRDPDPGHLLQRRRELRHSNHHQHFWLANHAASRADQHGHRRLQCVAASGIRRDSELVHGAGLPLHSRPSQVRLPSCSGLPASSRCHGHPIPECQPQLWSSELESINQDHHHSLYKLI